MVWKAEEEFLVQEQQRVRWLTGNLFYQPGTASIERGREPKCRRLVNEEDGAARDRCWQSLSKPGIRKVQPLDYRFP